METTSDRLRQFIHYKGFSVMSFEKIIGAGNNSIGTNIKRKSNLSGDILSKILNNFSEIDSEWLITGRGKMLKTYINEEIVQKEILDIGKRIKQARESKGLTSNEFADILKIENSLYNNIENGKLLPTLIQIIDIGNLLETSLDWLIAGKKINKPSLEKSYELALKHIKLQEELIRLKDLNYALEKKSKEIDKKISNN